MKKCGDCRFAVFQDTGYSNWTVEGTDFLCAKKMHPDGIFDKFYGEDKRLEFAEKCGGFDPGNSINMDVDRDNEQDLTDDQKSIWAMLGVKWNVAIDKKKLMRIPKFRHSS